MPVLAALLLAALDRQQATGGANWVSFLGHIAAAVAAGLPMLAAHLAALRLNRYLALAAWVAGFMLYPLALQAVSLAMFPLLPWHSLMAAGFSLATLLSRSARPGNLLPMLRRLPVTLDGSVAALLAVFALFSSSMFASTEDAVNNQPFRVWFDPVRLATHPLEFLGYLLQFAFAASLIFGFYWCCRYLLVQRVLRRQGWIAFAIASLAFWILYSPLAASLVLLLPLNPDHWSLLPSENQNPFDPLNYAFSFVFWATSSPIILASERLLAERSDAMGRHEQARAELYMLQQQINPHFLFNSLNTLYALCLQDRAASADAVVKLSDLLRYVVYQGQKEWVGLDEEIAYLRNYIDLQMLRFSPRCRLSCHWPDGAAQFQIPPLLLIMLVENAFKHGVEPVDQMSEVDIDLTLSGSHMDFTCSNAPFPDSVPSANDGLGLGNMRRRLELLFGSDFALSSERDGASWRARLELDLRPC